MRKAGETAPVARRVREKVVEVFGADLRSLAAFRMVLAVLVLADLAGRVPDLYAHYTDGGLLPRNVLQWKLNPWSFSLNLMNGELYFQVLVFGVGAFAALALLVGYRTRLMNAIVWVVLLSIQYRNPLLYTAGDGLLRMLLFWGMFLPLGTYWSFDRLLNISSRNEPPRWSMRFLSLATVGLYMQIAFVYWFTALKKSGTEWRVDGTAIYYALSLDQISTPLGVYLLNFPTLLTVLTFATLAFEFVGPLLLFYPFLTGPVRTGVVLIFMSFHLGIWLTMEIGIFPWVSALCMVCFLPGWFWEKIARLRSAFLPENPEILSRLQRAAARLVPVGEVRSSAVAAAGGGRASGVVMPTHENQPQGRDPRANPSPPPTGTTQQSKTPPATKAGQETPNGVASTSGPTMLRSSLVTNFLAAVFLLYIFLWNLTTVSSFTLPGRAVPLGHILGLEQDWSMFAPYPSRNDYWYILPGTLNNGQQVDLMGFIRDEASPLAEASWAKPQHVSDTFKNEHWRKYLNSLREEENADLREYFGSYLCSEWNARHTGAESLESFKIAYVKERTLPDYQTSTPQKVVLPDHSCS